MIYRVYIETNNIEKIDDYSDFDDMLFCLDYLVRICHWNRRILVIQHNKQLDMDEVFYLYNGNEKEYLDWRFEDNKIKQYRKKIIPAN